MRLKERSKRSHSVDDIIQDLRPKSSVNHISQLPAVTISFNLKPEISHSDNEGGALCCLHLIWFFDCSITLFLIPFRYHALLIATTFLTFFVKAYVAT